MSLSLADLDKETEEDEDALVVKDLRFFVKRISVCVLSLGLLFAFGLFAIKLRGGEITHPFVDCDTSAAAIHFDRYTIVATHSTSTPTPELQIIRHNASFTTILLSILFETDATQNTTLIDHSYCSGSFTTRTEGVYSMECETHIGPLWGGYAPVGVETVYCKLGVNSVGETATFVVEGGGGGGSVSCSTGNEAHAFCIGDNLEVAVSTPFTVLQAGDGVLARAQVPLLPYGIFNASLEFALLL